MLSVSYWFFGSCDGAKREKSAKHITNMIIIIGGGVVVVVVVSVWLCSSQPFVACAFMRGEPCLDRSELSENGVE
jgi:hypothetical protein